jgi:hypothetical protein
MVQIGDIQANIKAQPVGQVVKFSVCVKIYLASLRDACLPIGSAIIVAKMRIRFITTSNVCILFMTRWRVVARRAWQRIVHKKTPWRDY